MAGSMGNHERNFRRHCNRLGCHTTRPEQGYLSGFYRNWIAIVGPGEVSDPNPDRIANVNWRTVDGGIATGNLDGFDHIFNRNRTHGNDHRTMKNPSRTTVDAGTVHWHITSTFDMADWKPCC